MSALALRLDAVVRQVPGVVTVFAAAPVIVQSVRELTAGETPLTVVATDDLGLTITVSIGVDAEAQAPVTARLVSDAVRAALDGQSQGPAEIHVRVSRVTSAPPLVE